MNHIMVDIETLDTQQSAVVLSIGAAHIKLNGGSIYATEADAQAWADFNKWCRGGGV